MKVEELTNSIKDTVINVEACSTNATPKKGKGFTLLNVFGLKWGQVDVTDSYVKIVLDLPPRQFTLSELVNTLGIPSKTNRQKGTGMFIKSTEGTAPKYDALQISLYSSYFYSVSDEQLRSLLDLIRAAAEMSGYKSRPSYGPYYKKH